MKPFLKPIDGKHKLRKNKDFLWVIKKLAGSRNTGFFCCINSCIGLKYK